MSFVNRELKESERREYIINIQDVRENLDDTDLYLMVER